MKLGYAISVFLLLSGAYWLADKRGSASDSAGVFRDAPRDSAAYSQLNSAGAVVESGSPAVGGAVPPAKSPSPDFPLSTEAEFKNELSKHVFPVREWVKRTGMEGFDLLCLGETHDDPFRQAYGKLLSSGLAAPLLAFEEADPDLRAKIDGFKKNGRAELLGADLAPVLRAALAANPGVRFVGIDQTPEEYQLRLQEEIRTGSSRLTRDRFIAGHIEELWREQKRITALYGSLHCGRKSAGMGFGVPFFKLLAAKFPDKKLVSVLLLPPDEVSSPLRVYADSFDLTGEDVVIVGGRGIDPQVYNHRVDIENVFASYDVILMPRKTLLPDLGD